MVTEAAVEKHIRRIFQKFDLPPTNRGIDGCSPCSPTCAGASRSVSARVAEEQAALRKVATVVAEGMPVQELFAVVTEEAGRLFRRRLGPDPVRRRHRGGRHGDVGGAGRASGDPGPGRRRQPVPDGPAEKPSRGTSVEEHSGPIAETVRTELGFTSTVGAPILVERPGLGDGDGARAGRRPAAARDGGAPRPVRQPRRDRDPERAGAGGASTCWRTSRPRSALIATLVARERPPAEVFETVATEMGHLLGVEDVALMRYEEDQTATVVGRWGERARVARSRHADASSTART